MSFKDEEERLHYLRRRQELLAPLQRQIMLTDDKNEVLLLAAAMIERGYSILKTEYGKASAERLIKTLVDIVDERDGSV